MRRRPRIGRLHKTVVLLIQKKLLIFLWLIGFCYKNLILNSGYWKQKFDYVLKSLCFECKILVVVVLNDFWHLGLDFLECELMKVCNFGDGFGLGCSCCSSRILWVWRWVWFWFGLHFLCLRFCSVLFRIRVPMWFEGDLNFFSSS